MSIFEVCFYFQNGRVELDDLTSFKFHHSITSKYRQSMLNRLLYILKIPKVSSSLIILPLIIILNLCILEFFMCKLVIHQCVVISCKAFPITSIKYIDYLKVLSWWERGFYYTSKINTFLFCYIPKVFLGG